MYRPFSEEEKRTALRDGAIGAIKEAERRKPELQEMGQVAMAIWGAFYHSPTWRVEDGPLPSAMKSPPVEELWSVTPKVTFQQ